MKTAFKNEALDVMTRLSGEIVSLRGLQPSTPSSVNGYVSQRSIIYDVFDKTSGPQYSLPSIVLRLTVIDSLYSTNARYSYYSIDQLAEEIKSLGSEQDASKYFYDIVRGGEDTENLFSKPYGLRKNLDAGNTLMSLVSKYAYYALLLDVKSYPLGFPIYDSLVMEVYPKVCENLEIETILVKNVSPNINDYVSALNGVRIALFGNNDALFNDFQQFDILDAYLWRMGKFGNGNYSLLLNKADYQQFIANLELDHKDGEKLHTSYPSLKTKKDKTEFTNVVRHLCTTKSVSDIVNNLSNLLLMTLLLEHWRKYFNKNQKK